MRISTTQLFTDSTRNMLEGQSRLAEIQNKISSGKNFQSLAEDPVGASRVVNLKREMSQLETFQSNIDATRRQLSLEESTLADVTTGVIRARELIIQAGNGSLNDSDRRAISYEIEEIVDYLANLMNTRDAKGEYLFSGSKGATQSYARQPDGTYQYQGDSTTREIQIASSQYIASSDTGQALFQAVTPSVGLEVLGATSDLKSGIDTSSGLVVSDEAAFSASFAATGDLSLTVAASTASSGSYTLSDSAGNVVSGPVTYSAVPVEIELTGATLTLSPQSSGSETVTLRYSETEGNVLNTLVANVEALRTLSSNNTSENDALYDNLELTLNQLDAVQARLSDSVASMGGRLNVLDAAEYSNSDFKLLTETTLSAVEDLDYTSASTELAKRQLALEASYASFAKIQGLSLFNYID